MKKKNRINPLEAHLEKLVLGAVSVVLLAVVAMQFLAHPNAVKIGNSPTPVAPDRIYEQTKSDAERLLVQMRSVSPEVEIPQQTVTTSISDLAGIGGAEGVRVAAIGGSSTGIEGDIGPGAGDLAATTYVLPALPAPRAPVAASHRVAADPFEVTANPELKKYVPAQQPFDLAAVSVEGVVDASSLRQSLEQAGEGEARPLPLSWWRGNVNLLAVEVEREELSQTGSWGNATRISGMPGGVDLLQEVRQGSITPVRLLQVSEDARLAMRQIAQPAFPRSVAGPDWVRPSERVGESTMSEAQLEIQRLLRRLKDTDRRIANVEEQLGQAGGGSSSGGADPRSERGGGGRRGEGGGGGGGGQDNRARLEEQQRANLEATLNRLLTLRDRIVADLAALGHQVEAQEQTGGAPAPLPPLPDLLSATELPVWMHDLSAEPGKTYRYRMRLVINNPLYQRGQFLSEAQRGEAASPVREGPWSAWTDAVAMEADRQYFVVSASEDDAMGSGPKAQVEVYEFYYGYWRKGSASLEPGDSIRATAKLPDNLLIWDQQTLDAGAAPRARPGQTTGPGGRDPIDPGLDRRRMIEEGFNERETARTRNQPQPAAEENALPEGATAGPKSLPMRVNATLLDVVRVPGADNAYEAILRAPDGSLMVQRASREGAGPLYRLLAASAREGEEQGRPEPEPVDRTRPGNDRTRIPEEEDVRGPGGG